MTSVVLENDRDLATDSTQVMLERDARGRLVYRSGPDAAPVENVRLARCFPWLRPQEFISIRDSEGNEVALIEEMGSLAQPVRELVERELAAHEFLPCILAVRSVDDRFDVMVWQVQTDRGAIELQVKHTEDVRELPGGRIAIRDYAGGLFLIPDLGALDARSQRLVLDRLA